MVIPKVRGVATYKSACEFFKHIDALPPGPKFSCTPLKVKGDLTDTNGNNRLETLELWHCDPIEYVAELLGICFLVANNSTHLCGYLGIKMEPIGNLGRCGLLIGGGRHK